METRKPPPDAREKPPKRRRRLWLYALFPPALVAFVLGVFSLPGLAREWIVETNVVPSGAMKDTILVGDYIATDKRTYRFRDPRPGEVVTFIACAALPGLLTFRDMTRAEKIRYVFEGEYGDGRSGGLRLLIKRVVGGPGDVVEIRRGILYRNGEQVREPYVLADAGADWGPYAVPPESYFVMGDNRYDSADSRMFGPVPRKYIRGRVAVIYFSVAPVSCPKHRAPIVCFGDGWRCSAEGEEMRPGLDFKPAPRWRLDRRIRWERVGKRFAPPEAVAHKLNNICE
jgi:signal peptidase I